MYKFCENYVCPNFCVNNTKILHFLYNFFAFILQKFYTFFASLFNTGMFDIFSDFGGRVFEIFDEKKLDSSH